MASYKRLMEEKPQQKFWSTCCGLSYAVVAIDAAHPLVAGDAINLQLSSLVNQREKAAAQRDTLGCLGYFVAVVAAIAVLILSVLGAEDTSHSTAFHVANSIITGVSALLAGACVSYSKYRDAAAGSMDKNIQVLQKANAADMFISPETSAFSWPAPATTTAAQKDALAQAAEVAVTTNHSLFARSLIPAAIAAGNARLAVNLDDFADQVVAQSGAQLNPLLLQPPACKG